MPELLFGFMSMPDVHRATIQPRFLEMISYSPWGLSLGKCWQSALSPFKIIFNMSAFHQMMEPESTRIRHLNSFPIKLGARPEASHDSESTQIPDPARFGSGSRTNTTPALQTSWTSDLGSRLESESNLTRTVWLDLETRLS